MVVWDWLNNNAGAMQAIASVASVAVTVVLVVITWRYVRLTKGLAEAANAELLGQSEASKARRRELTGQIKLLLDALATLPNWANWDHVDLDATMRDSNGWENFDFGGFRELAAEVNDDASSHAAIVESKMRRMEELVRRARKPDPGLQYVYYSGMKNEWLNAMQTTQEALASMLEELSAKS
jgi:hypothetical protein